MSRFVLTLALLAGFAMITPAHAALNACASAKKQCVAKKTAAILKCHAMNEKPPGISLVKFQACVQKAKDKFDGRRIRRRVLREARGQVSGRVPDDLGRGEPRGDGRRVRRRT